MRKFLLRYITVIVFVFAVSLITILLTPTSYRDYANMIFTVLLIALVPAVILILCKKRG